MDPADLTEWNLYFIKYDKGKKNIGAIRDNRHWVILCVDFSLRVFLFNFSFVPVPALRVAGFHICGVYQWVTI